MKNLDTLKGDIRSELEKRGFVVFHSQSRAQDPMPYVKWDSKRYPDFGKFLEVAAQLGVKLVSFHHSELDPEIIESSLDDLSGLGLEFDDEKTFERRLRELSVYEGFICVLELSFEHDGTLYFFELRADWYDELLSILDDLDLAEESEGVDDEDFGGYYSKN